MEEEEQSLESKVDKIIKEPITAKEKAGALVCAVVLIALCVGVWMLPDLVNIDTSEFSGGKGRGIARMLNFIWSRPVGSVAGVIGLLLGISALNTKVGK